MPSLEVCNLRKVSKTYRDRTGTDLIVFRDLSLQLLAEDSTRGNAFVLLGRSGCGKTTLLDMLAGVQFPTGGTIQVLGQPVSSTSGKTAIMPQEPSCFPWLTVIQNVEFGLRLRNSCPRHESRAVATRLLKRVGLDGRAGSYPRELSGGMQQRVVLARTLAVAPPLLLLDEPFGSLDNETRSEMHILLLSTLFDELNHVIFVTHDVEEAAFLGDTVIILPSSGGHCPSQHRVPFGFPRNSSLRFTDEYIQFVELLKQSLTHS